MKISTTIKLIVLFGVLLLSNAVTGANVRYTYATALILDNGGVEQIYNTTAVGTPTVTAYTAGQNAINQTDPTIYGTISLGPFTASSGVSYLKLQGAESRTYKEGTGTNCAARLQYVLYENSSKPSPLVYTAMTLPNFATCPTGPNFSDGAGPCATTGYEKWRVSNSAIALTANEGKYTLEFYYQVQGASGGGCVTWNSINSNFKVTYAVNPTLTYDQVVTPLVCGANGSILLNTVGIADGTYSDRFFYDDGQGGTTYFSNVVVASNVATIPAPAGVYDNITYYGLSETNVDVSADGNSVEVHDPAAPAAPTIDLVHQPDCTTATGSVDFSGLPTTGDGTWRIEAVTGGVTTLTKSSSGATITFTGLLQSTTYKFKVFNSIGCVSSLTSDVVFNAQPEIPVVTNQVSTICSTGTFTVTPVDNGTTILLTTAGSQYSWGLPVVTGGITGGATGTAQASISGTLVNPTTVNQTATYTVTPKSLAVGTCDGATFTVTVTVQPATAISAQSTATQTQCLGGTFTAISVTANGTGTLTYQWYSNAANSNVGGISLGASNGAQTSSYTPQAGVAGTLYYYCIVTSDCATATSTVSGAFVTQATVTAGLIGTDQTICNGDTPAALTSTGAGVGDGAITYEWQTDASGSYVTIGGQVAATYAPPALTSTTNYKRRSVSTLNGTVCYSAYTTPVTITVQATPGAGTIGTAQTICNGATPAALTSTGVGTGSGVISYEWQTDASGSYVTIGGEVAATYAPPALTSTTNYQRRTVSTLNGVVCYSAYTIPVAITVQSTPTAGTIGTAQTVCNGSIPATLTSTVAGGGSGVITYEWQTNASGSYVDIPAVTSATYSPPALLATTSYQRRTVSTQNGTACYSAYTAAITITVQSTPTAGTIGTAQTICNGDTPAAFTSTVDGTGSGVLTYEWQTNASGSYVTIGGQVASTYAPPALTSTTSYQRRTVSTENGVICYSAYTPAVMITVQATPSAGTIGTAQTICNGSTPASLTSTLAGGGDGVISYEWQTNASGSYVTIGGEVAATYAPPVLFATTSYQRRTVSTLNGVPCYSAYTSAITITVNNAVTAGSINIDQTICNGDVPAALTSVAGTGSGVITYEWMADNGSGYSTIVGIVSATYAPGALLTTTSYKRRTVSVSGGTTCYSNYTVPVVITVQSAVTAGTIGTSQTICNGDTPAALSSTVDGTGSGTISYEWQVDDGSGYVNIAGEFTNVYTPGALLTTNSYKRRTVSTTNAIPCYSAYTTPVTITVQATPTAGTIATAQVICNGSTPATLTSTVDGAGDGVISYEWQTNASGAFVTIGGETSSTYSPPSLLATTSYKRRTVSVLNGVSCYSAYTPTITITVNTVVTAGTISADQVICNGDAPAGLSSTLAGTGSGVISYQWQYDDGSGYSTIAGITTATYSPGALLLTTNYRRRTKSVSGGTTCYSGYTTPVVITVNAAVTAGTIGTSQVICNGSTPAALTSTVNGTGDGVISYEWQFDDGSGYAPLVGEVTSTYAPGALTVSTSYKRRTVSLSGGTTCYSAYTSPVDITVNNSVTAGTISADQTICNGSTPATLTSTAAGTGSGVISYEWQADNGGGYGTIGAAVGATYSPAALLVTTSYKRRTVSISGGVTCYSSYTAPVTITVQSAVVAGTIGTAQTICNGDVPAGLTSSADGSGSGVISYEWQVDDGTGYVTIGGETASTYSPGALTVSTSYKRRTVSLQNGVNCYSSYTSAITITVNNLVTAGTIATAQTICNGSIPSTLTSTVAGSGSGVISYEWQEDSGSGYSTIAAANASTYSPGALLATTSFKRRTVSVNGGITCYSSYTAPIVITVNLDPTAGSIAADQTICSGDVPASITNSSLGTGSGIISYQWQADSGSGYNTIAGALLSSYSPGALLTTTSYKRRTKTVSGGTTCYSAYTTPVTITVNSAATAGTISADQTICNGDVPAALTSTADGTGSGTITYEWQVDDGLGGGFVNIIGEVLSTYAPGALTATTVYQRRTKTVSGGVTCYSAYTSPVTITVNDVVTAGTIGGTETICNGSTPTGLTSTASGNGTGSISYEWQYDDGSGYSTIAGATFSTYSPGALLLTTNYKRRTVSVSGGKTCYSSYTAPITKTVNSAVGVGTIGTNQIICNGDVPATISSTADGSGDGVVSYQWQYDAGAGYATVIGASASSYSPGALVTTTTYRRRTKSVSGATCYSNWTTAVTITVGDAVTAGTIAGTQSICNGSTPVALTSSADGTGTGSITYEWQADNGSGYSTIGGATSSTYAPGALAVTTSYKRRTVADNAGTICNSAYTPAITITVTPVTAISAQSTGAQTQCGLASFTPITVTATGTGTVSYQWYSNAAANTTTGSTLGVSNGAQTNSYTPQSTANGTLYYYCIVHSDCGTDVTSALSGAFIVLPLPSTGLTVGGGGGAGICSNTSTNITVASSVVGVKYQLRNDNANQLIGSEVIGTGGTINLPTGTLTTTTTFNVLAIDPVTACSAQLTQKQTVTVNNLPTIALDLDPAPNVCNGAVATVNLAYTAQSADTYAINYDATAEGVGFVDVAETAMIPSPFVIPVPTVAGGQEGVFNAILTVKHTADGCTQDYPFTVTISPAIPSSPGAITGSTTPCSGSTQVYSVSAVTNPGWYNWTYPADWTVAVTPGLEHSNSISLVVGPTSGNVTVRAENACGLSVGTTSTAMTVSASPAANAIIGSANVCNGATGSVYSATTNNPGNSYAWTVVGGTITSGAGTSSIQVTWNVVGAGTVDMTETSGSCSTVATQKAVTVNAIPTPVITGSASVCNGTTGSVYSVTNVVGNTYAWSVSGGTIASGAGTNSITVDWNVAGAGTVDVTETITASGCSTASTQKAVTVLSLPTPVIVGAAAVCNGTTGSVYSVTNVLGHTYSWSVVGGNITAGTGTNSITVTWNVAGVGTVDVTETITATGCVKSATQKSVTVNALPTPVIAGATDVCDGTTGSVYSVTSVLGNTYAWSVSGGVVTAGAGTNSITVTWNVAGSGTVDVTETITATGCSTAAAQLGVNVNALPNVSITGNDNECVGATASTYFVTNVAGNTYLWSVVGGTITSGQNTNSIQITWNVAGAGTVDVTQTVTLTGCSKAAPQKAVTVHALPTPVITGAATACANETGVVYSTPLVAGHTYSWSVVGGVVTAGAATRSITVTWGAAGAGTVDLVETITATGCANSATQKAVTINALPTPVITGAVSACENESGDVFSTTNVVGNTYSWIVVGGAVTAGTGTNSITVTWGTAGVGTIDLTETTTATGCSKAATQKSLTINPLPTPVITGNGTACANEAGVVYSTPNVIGNTYSWNVVGGAITAGAGTNSITVTWGAAGAGTVDLTETITATACANSASQKSVTINPLPTPVIVGSASVCANEIGSVYSVTNVVGHTYNWNVVGGAITAGGGTNSITVTWGAAGAGTVDLTETISATACSKAATQVAVTINALPTPVIAGAISVCAAETGSVYSTTNIAGHTYAWSVVGGAITAGAGTNSITVTWGAAGAGTVDLTETITASACATIATQKSITIKASPSPVITGSAAACANETGLVYSSPLVAGHTYAWSVAGGVVTAGAATNSITVTWGVAGAGTVDLTETLTSNGCSNTATQKAVTINALPTPVITGSATACAAETGSVYSTTANVGHVYNWSVVGGVVTAGTGTNSITVAWGVAGAGTVDLTETITATGCATIATQKSVTINATPTPTITGSATACANESGAVYSAVNVAGHTYNWSVAGGAISAGTGTNSITVTWGAAGAGTVDLVETITATGCFKAASQKSVTINALPSPIIVGAITACAPEAGVVYSTTNVAGHTYSWNVSGGIITAGTGTNSITVTWNAPGAGSVDVTETITATGCSKAATQLGVTVNSIPAPTITGSAIACANETGSVYSTPNVVGNTYNWSVVGGTITAGTGTNSITVTWNAAGAGTVDVTETVTASGCFKAASQKNVTINALPTPVITGAVTACANEVGVVYSTPNIAGHTYSWSVIGGAITAGTATNSITVTWGVAGAGTVDLVETITATACFISATQKSVTISALPTPVITGSATACANEAGVVYSTPNVVGHTYSWSVVGGAITAGTATNSITVTWGAAGAGTVDLTETITATACSKAASQIAVTVNSLPTPVIVGSANACANEIGAIYSVTNVAGHSYSWNVVGGAITAGAGTNSITITWGGVGAGSVDLTETITASGCSKAATQKAVSINPIAPVSPGVITGTLIQCPALTGQVYSVAAVANATTYTWTVPTAWAITAGQGTTSVTVTAGAGGDNGNISVTAGNSCGTSPAQSLAVQVLGVPATPGTITGTATNCPTALEVYSIAAVSGATTYTWSVPTGWTITSGAGTTDVTVSTGTAGQNGNVTVTAGNSCGNSAAKTLAVTVSAPPAAPTVGVITQPSCNVATGGVVLSGLPAGLWTVTRYPGAVATASSGNSLAITGLLPSNTYNFTVTNAMGCTSALSADVIINANLSTPTTPTISSMVQPTCNTATGSVVLNSLPAVGTWTLTRTPGNVQISSTGTSKTIVGLAPGTYTYTVTDANTCISLSSANIVIDPQPQVPSAPLAIVGGATQCAAVSEIYSVAKVTGATAYTWTVPTGWNITAGQGTDSITVTTGTFGQDGNISVTADNICGASTAQTLAVAISLPPSAPTIGAKVQPNCLVPTGSVTLTNLPAVGTWILTATPGGVTTTGTGTSTTITGLIPNTYTYKVTNAAGCISTTSANVVITANASNPAKPTIGLVTQPTCAVGTGSVLLTGLPAGAWTINPGAIAGAATSTTISNLAPGKYVYSVTDAGACVSLESDTITIDLQPLVPAKPGTITGQIATCPLTTEIYSIASVQFATTYTWSVPAGWTITAGQGTNTLTVKSGTAGQNGNISVTAGNTCGTSAANVLAVTVNVAPGAPSVELITQPTCSDPNGTVVLNNLPAGDWVLNPGAIAGSTTSYKIFDLLPGTYNYTVTNSAGCNSPASANVVINANLTTPLAPTVFALNQPSCSVPSGSVSLGGLPAGNWTINPGAITGTGNAKAMTGLLPGTYSYAVTNASGCTSLPVDVVINANVNTPTAPLVDLVTQPSGGIITGSVDLSGLPANGTWSLKRLPDNATITGTGTSTTVSGLVAGTYNFEVTNAAGCLSLSSDNVIINPPAPVALGVISGLAIQCPAATAQVYSVVAVANATTYTWAVPASWSITSGQGTNSIQVTTGPTGADGNITVTAGNINGNSAPQVLAVQVFGIPTTPITISGAASACPAASEVYSVTPVAGANAYTWTVPVGWTITNGNGTSSITVSTGVFGQNGNITVSAGNDCGFSAVKTLAVTVNTPPTTPVVGALSQPNCNVATGGVILSGLPAGNWVLTRFPGNVATPGSGTTYAVTGLAPATTYNFMVSNANSCMSALSADVVIDANASTPSAPMISAIVQPSCGLATGRVTLSSLPAVGTWTLTRTPGTVITTGTGTTKTITNLAPGTYTYIVADASGCVSLVSEDIVIDPQPLLPASPALIKGGALQCAAVAEIYSVDKVVDATSYTWTVPAGWTITSGQGTDSIAVITGAAGQIANLTVTANSICGSSAPQSLTVQISTPPNAPTVGAIVQPSCPVPTGSVTLNNLPAVGTWTLTRMPDAVTKTGNGTSVLLTGLIPNTYTYTVTNAAGCVSAPTANIVITANPSTPAKPTIGLITQPSCGVATGKVVLAGLPAGSWTINPGGITGASSSTTVANLAAGKYAFSVTDVSGCVSLPSDTVTILPQPFTPVVPGIITGSVSNCATQVEVYTIADVPNATTYTWTVPLGWSITSGQGTTTLTVKTGAAGDNGNISVTAGNACGTSAAKIQSVSVSVAPTAPTVGLRTQPTCADPMGAVVLNGLPAGDWEINPGAIKGITSSYKIYDLIPGTYNFTVTNSAGCTSPASASVIINANASVPAKPSFNVVTQPTCAVATGTVTLAGLPTGIWTINPGAIVGNGSTKVISGLLPGKYSFTVTNASNCTSLSADTVIVPNVNTPATPLVGAISHPTCTVFTGSVVLSGLPSGNWTLTRLPDGKVTNGVGADAIIAGLDPGTYNFKVVNSMGCVSLLSDNVVIDAIPITPTTPIIQSVIQPTCAAAVGTVILSGLPATGTWTLTRFPDGVVKTGVNSSTTTITDLSPGTYSFMVTNSVGCNSILTANVVLSPATLPALPTASFVQQPTLASATGTISFTVQNGVEYSINGTDFQSIAIFNAVSPGTYTLTVRKAADHTCTADGLTKVTLSSVGPKANADFVKVNENDSITISVLANDDFGQDPPKATAIVATNGLHGTVTVLDNGTPNNQKDDKLRYIPEAYYDGPDSFSYTICSENGMCSTATVDVTVADIDQLVQVTKKVTKPELRKDGTYWLTYSIVVKNKTSNIISQMQVVDDLSKTFLAPVTYKVVSATSSSRLHPNTQYDGAYDLNTLVGDGQLFGSQSDSVIIVVQIDPNGYTGAVYNQAVMSGISSDGPMYNIRSDDGSMQLEPKKTESALSAIKLVAPAAFTPNNDGLNDKYIILHSSVLRVKFQVFNRWGSIVYKSDDYQNDWEGKGIGMYANQDLPNGTYYYVIEMVNGQTGEVVQKNGYLSLKR